MRSALSTNRFLLKASVFGLMAGLLLAPAALAVEQTGTIEGTIRDEKGKPLPGVTLTLTGVNIQGERAAVTDVRGDFAFRAIPAGVASLKINAPGYQVIEQEVTVGLGRVTPVVFSMTPGTLTETVRVTGAVPLVDPVHTTTQDNYTTDYLENVQVGSAGRDYLSVISNSAGTGPGDGANPTVRGSTIGQNVYLVDGVDSTDPVTATFGTNLIYDSIQEIQFQTGAFAPEFGRATGGIINVVTKSGGNSFSGSIDGRYSNENFIEKGEHFDPDQLDIDRRIAEGTLGGPVVKDKLWFFLAGSYIRSDSGAAGTPSVRSFDGRYYLGKLTWQASPQHKFTLQATGDPAEIDNADASVLVSPEANSKQTQGSKFFTLQYLGTLTPNVILQVQAARYKSQLDSEPQSGDLSTPGQINIFTGEQSANAIDAQFSDRFRDQANVTLTWNKNDWGGDHTFKTGVDVQDLKFEFTQFTPGGEYYDTAPDATGVLVPLLINDDQPAGVRENTGLVIGYFIQDDWRVHPRLSVTYGVRYDTFSYDDDEGNEVFSADLLQPRLRFSWDATGDQRNVFKVNAARYADASMLAVPRIVNSRANGTDLYINETIANYFVNGTPTPFDFNGNGIIEARGFFATFGGPGGSRFARGGNLDATTTVEYQGAYERQLSPASAVSLTLVHRKTSDIIEDEANANGIYIVDNVGRLGRRYYGAEARYRTQWRKLYLSGSYNWAKSKGNVEYTQSLGTDYDFPVHRINRYGYLTDDTRHFVRLNGYLDLPWRMQMGYGYFWASGFPFNRVANVAPYGVLFLEPRGSRRGPAQHQLDLEFRKGFPIGDSDLRLIFAIRNAFDTEIVTAHSTLSGEAVSYQTPRRYEVGMRFRF